MSRKAATVAAVTLMCQTILGGVKLSILIYGSLEYSSHVIHTFMRNCYDTVTVISIYVSIIAFTKLVSLFASMFYGKSEQVLEAGYHNMEHKLVCQIIPNTILI